MKLPIKERLAKAYEDGKAQGYSKGRTDEQILNKSNMTAAKVQVLNAATELVKANAKMLYHINMMINDKKPFG